MSMLQSPLLGTMTPVVTPGKRRKGVKGGTFGWVSCNLPFLYSSLNHSFVIRQTHHSLFVMGENNVAKKKNSSLAIMRVVSCRVVSYVHFVRS